MELVFLGVGLVLGIIIGFAGFLILINLSGP